ncbi:glycosyltransferase family 90 protein [Tulasnella calospora MUT 4182]|uniref:Glycosyltransferase family 90 protein n=1 Tax=Tulasnella calospora MUT 4182 TaxID=1051891 RepID=A0A0C3Q5L5_9AGAM|nr:glycosyltransferase family 90 protein [Tulasnella calospora MUT 4182]
MSDVREPDASADPNLCTPGSGPKRAETPETILPGRSRRTAGRHRAVIRYMINFVGKTRDPKTAHRYGPDGVLEVNQRGPHPIYEMIAWAEKEWKSKNAKASKTLDQAVAEYKRRYGRAPPKGFDKWWSYVKAHRVQLPDEYDRIYHDLEPFWGVDPLILQASRAAREHEAVGYFHHFLQEWESRSGGQLELLKPVQGLLPDFRATFTARDVPNQFLPYESRKAALEAAAQKKGMSFWHASILEKNFPKPKASGWSSACPPTSPLGQKPPPRPTDPQAIWKVESSKSFIYDHKLALDVCDHPSQIHLNGIFQSPPPPPSKDLPAPSFSICSTSLHSDILSIPTTDWLESTTDDPQWNQKPHSKIYWRGNNTGAFEISKDGWWNLTQRARFISAVNAKDGDLFVLPSTESKYEPVGMGERTEQALLNEQWIDALFTGPPVQCEGAMCKELEKEYKFVDGEPSYFDKQWKFLMDIDGNGCSSRFKRLMTTRGLVLKSTIHPEWWTDRIQAWVHYVPIKYDYTDLYDIMAFFKGDIDGTGGNGHDEPAAQIGAGGRKWSVTFFRKEDMIAYVYRLFLEYARVMSPDRDQNNFEV